MKKLLAAVTTALLALAMVVVTGAPASATETNKFVNADCQVLAVDLDGYKVVEGESYTEYLWYRWQWNPKTAEEATDEQSVERVEGNLAFGGWEEMWSAEDPGRGWFKAHPEQSRVVVVSPGDETPNHVKIWIDGVVVTDEHFGAAFSIQHNFADKSVAHSYRVVVTTFDGKRGFDTGEKHTVPCATATEPVVMPVACTGPGAYGQGSYTIPEIAGVKYFVKVNDGKFEYAAPGEYFVGVGTTVTAKAEAAKGYVLHGDDSWGPYTFESPGDCLVEAVVTAPTFTPAECAVWGHHPRGTVVIPAVDGVKYYANVNGKGYIEAEAGTYPFAVGTKIKVKAIAEEGYYLTGDHKWFFVVKAPENCHEVPEFVVPTVVDQVCDVETGKYTSGSITIPDVKFAKYYFDGNLVAAGTYELEPGEYEVKAKVYSHHKHYWKSWTLTVEAAEPCLPTLPIVTPHVKQVPITCETHGYFKLWNDLGKDDAIVWKVDGKVVDDGKYTMSKAGTVHVKAYPAKGYGFDEDAQTEWKLVFKLPKDCADRLAETGPESGEGYLAGAALLLLLGAGLVRADRRLFRSRA